MKLLSKIDFSPEEDIDYLKEESNKFVKLLKKYVSDADIFVGGSFAKNTLIKSDEYDIDIFVRYKQKEKLSEKLEKSIIKISKEMKLNYERIHGSRDYFRISPSKKLTFEIIPVLKIRKVSEAENVTDLSYFHVNYVKRNLPKEKVRDVRLAKQFCKALKVYGAESYIHGFSGYALECLIIYYGSFEKMVKVLSKAKEKIVIDIAKHYKRKEDILIELNESKTLSPIVLVDPTWKERNVLAALSEESFKKFQSGCIKLLKNPSEKIFEVEEINPDKLKNLAKKKEGEFVHVMLKTDKQAGDIAGTKLKKFAEFLKREINKRFDILKEEFEYKGGKSADVYLVLKPKKEILKTGPPVDRKKDVKKFKEKNPKTFIKEGRIFAKETVDFSGKEIIKKVGKTHRLKMGITNVSIK